MPKSHNLKFAIFRRYALMFPPILYPGGGSELFIYQESEVSTVLTVFRLDRSRVTSDVTQ